MEKLVGSERATQLPAAQGAGEEWTEPYGAVRWRNPAASNAAM
jgi:hypothetical protein